MSDTSHMPGPWFIDPEQPLYIQAADGDAEPWMVARAFANCGYSTDTATANARLIASAPDLAAEVERLRDVLTDIGNAGTPFSNATVRRITAKARTALEAKP